jgi:ATP-binding cassette subfamily B (MDR/TAP) protein 1
LDRINLGPNRQTRELQAGTSQVFGHLVCESITSLASLGIAFYFSWKLTLVLLATLPISFIILWLASKSLEPAILAQKDILAVASKHLTSSITAIDLVKVFNGYDQGVYHYCSLVKLAAAQYLIQARCSAIQMGYTSFWVINLFVIGFYYGIVLVNHGLNPGVVITTFYATLTSFQGIEALLPHWLVIIKGVSAGSFLSGLMKEDESADKTIRKEIHVKPERCFGAIEFSNVSMNFS